MHVKKIKYLIGGTPAGRYFTISPMRKTDEHAFETTSAAEDIIHTCYNIHHSDPRDRENVGPMIAILSDGTGGFRRGVGQFLGEEVTT